MNKRQTNRTQDEKISPEIATWTRENFSEAFTSDKRRKARIIALAERMAKFPGKSIPQLFARPYDIKAVYNLLKHPESTPDSLQRGHREMVSMKIEQPGTYLLIEDDSSLSWYRSDIVDGFGPVGDFKSDRQGFNLHSVLAMKWDPKEHQRKGRRPPLPVIGLIDQQFRARKRVSELDKKNRSHASVEDNRERESDLWRTSIQRIGKKPESADIRWIRVCDRGADIYEVLRESIDAGYDFVIRSAQDRILLDDNGEEKNSLFNMARSLPTLGSFQLEIRGSKGKKERIATIGISVAPIIIRAPKRGKYARGTLPPVRCYVVYAHELNPPRGEEGIEWILLCSEQTKTFEEAVTRVRQYSCRWIIEEFHKALKTGLGAEKLQLEEADRLFAAISIMSIVALRLIDLRERIRLDPEGPAENSGLDPLELAILSAYLQRPIETMSDAGLAIGRLGGHLNRKRDGSPGIITLWRGLTFLRSMVEGARIALENKSFAKFG